MNALPPRPTVVRFTLTERVYHWVQAIPYLVLLVSGILQLVARKLGIVILPLETLVLTHKIAGAALPIGMFLVFLGGDRRILLHNAKLALNWRFEDLRWLALVPVHRILDLELPPSGKFNSGQKLNLLAQMVLIPIFAASGAWMWFRGEALLPWYVHVASFAIATPLILGHLFLALVHPGTRKGLSGVFSGRVDANWACHHYAKEYGVLRQERSDRA